MHNNLAAPPLICPIKQHQGLPLTEVCLQIDCPQRGVMCNACRGEHHLGHKIYAYTDFVEYLQKQTHHHEKVQQRLNHDIISLQEAKTAHVLLLQKVRKQMNLCLDQTQIMVAARFDVIQKKIQTEAGLYFKVEKLQIPQSNQPISAYIEQFKTLADCLVQSNNLSGSLVNSINFDVKNTVDICNSMEKKLMGTLNQIRCSTQMIDMMKDNRISQLHLVNIRPQSSLKWNQTLKHPDILCSQAVIRRYTHTFGLAVGILLEEPLNQGPSLKHSWAIKILNKTGLIMLGICLSSSAHKSKFTDNELNGRSHGHYLISSQVSFSSIHNSVNNKSIPFSFSQGDTIQLQYDRTKDTLKFTNNKSENFQLQIGEAKPNEYYHGCVYISAVDDCVALVTHHKLY